MKIDYYKVLGIARDASISDVKQAFRKLALQFHPDRHGNSSCSSREAAGHRFKEVSEAYEVLGDEVKRAAYDRAAHYHHHPGYDRSAASSRYEGPTRRRYYRRTQQGYTTYGRATESSTFYGERTGMWWNSELSGPERREKIFNAIFLGVALPIFLFADHITEALWPTKKYVGIDLDTQKTPQCSRKIIKPAQRRIDDQPAPAVVVSVPHDDAGHRSVIRNSSGSNYAYMAGTGFRKLESVKEVALQKMPHNSSPAYHQGLLDLRSLLMLEGRLSDLKLSELQTWLGHRTWIGAERKKLLGLE